MLNPGFPGTRRTLLTTLLACLAAPGAQAASAAEVRAAVDSAIQPLMAQYDIPGMAVALTADGQRYVFNYGVASRQSGVTVDDATLFELGSVSKALTATLAAYAQETGRLSLADYPGRYVPRLLGKPIDSATLLQLATYTAGGLPLQFPDGVAANDDAALGYLAGWTRSAAPGTVREYSNPSLGLLGHVVGIAMKDGFDKAMEQQLLPRLGMAHSHLHVPASATSSYAWGHRRDKAVRVSPGPFDMPTYGMKSTAADVLRFVQANIDPSGLEPTLRRAIEATQVGHFRAGAMVQGLGWEQYPWPLSRELLLGGNSEEMIELANPVLPAAPQPASAPRLFNKTGSTGGFGAYVAFVPSRRIGLVMLANRNYPIPARVEAAYAILSTLTGDANR